MNQTTATVAQLFTNLVEATDKTQEQIAREVGFPHSNIISMLKKGRARLPMGRIKSVARALGTDEFSLLCHCLQEYQPETWELIRPHLPESTDHQSTTAH